LVLEPLRLIFDHHWRWQAAVMLHKRGLHTMQMAGLAQAFKDDDLVRAAQDGERQAGANTSAVHLYGACAALAVITFLFGSGKIDILAQAIQQSGSGIELDFDGFAVPAKCERGPVAGHRNSRSLRRCYWAICGGVPRIGGAVAAIPAAPRWVVRNQHLLRRPARLGRSLLAWNGGSPSEFPGSVSGDWFV
jgi:hypothetical protein